MSASSSNATNGIALDYFNESNRPISIIREYFSGFEISHFMHWIFKIDSNPSEFMKNNKSFLTAIALVDGLDYFDPNTEEIYQRPFIEGTILKSLESLDKSRTIRLLSMGSDNFYQDFLLLITLYHKGYRKIRFDHLDVTGEAQYPSYQSRLMKLLIQQFNHFIPDSKIDWKSVNNAQQLPDGRRYDAVFGIGLHDAQRLIGLNVATNQESPANTANYSHMVSQIIQAASHLHQRETAVFCLDNGIQPLVWDKSLTPFGLDLKSPFIYVCITSNIFNLINSMQNLINNPPKILFIDAAILDSKTRNAVARLLDLYPAINYQIQDKASIVSFLKTQDNNSTLVVDDSYIFDIQTQPASDYFPPCIHHKSSRLSQSAYLHATTPESLLLPSKSLKDSLEEYRAIRTSESDSLLTLRFKSYARKETKIAAIDKLAALLEVMKVDNYGPEEVKHGALLDLNVIIALKNFTNDEVRALDEGRLSTLIPVRLLRIIKLFNYDNLRRAEDSEYLGRISQFFRPELSSTNKLETVGKLKVRYIDPYARVQFSEQDFLMMEQGRLGQIISAEIIAELRRESNDELISTPIHDPHQ